MARRRLFRKRRTFRKRVYRKKTRRVYRKRRVTAKRVMRAIERKTAQAYNLGMVINSSSHVNFPNNCIQLGLGPTIPINQGITNSARIGNRIQTKYFTFKGTITPLGYNSTSNPIPCPGHVRMVIFYDRQSPTNQPVNFNDFFQNNTGNSAFLDDLTDLWRPYNTDKYRILTQRTFKVGAAVNTGSGALAANANLANNDFKMNASFKINLTKYYPKNVKFDENSANPTTRSLYCLFYPCAATGSSYGAGVIPFGVQYAMDYTYTDA